VLLHSGHVKSRPIVDWLISLARISVSHVCNGDVNCFPLSIGVLLWRWLLLLRALNGYFFLATLARVDVEHYLVFRGRVLLSDRIFQAFLLETERGAVVDDELFAVEL